MDEMTPLVALISATPAAIPPTQQGFSDEFPSAVLWNLLDDRLLPDARAAGGVTPTLERRMARLIRHAVDGGADAVLLTCSMYGGVTGRVPVPVPIYAPDEAAFADIVAGGYRKILLVASIESALEDSITRLQAEIDECGQPAVVQGALATAAFDAANRGNTADLVTAIRDACGDIDEDVDAVFLAQYSLAPARDALTSALGVPVHSGPHSAARTIRERLRSKVARTSGTIGAIADDFTGATDVALAFADSGLETLIFFGQPGSEAALPPHDASVIALKSRSVPAAEAVDATLTASRWLTAHGADQIYFKYCSTFDSTPAGNLGPVLDALARETGAPALITTPSSPQHGRTVYRGHLFVGDVLLSESPMRNHPITPMTDANLPRLLRAQTDAGVGLIALPTVQEGPECIRAALDAATRRGAKYLIADALIDADLDALAVVAREHPVVAGAAGLAGALATARATHRGHSPSDARSSRRGRGATIAGSCSARTLEQIRDFEQRGNPTLRLDALTSNNPQTLAAEALSWADALEGTATPLIYSSLEVAELQKVQERLGRAESAALFETTLGLIAKGLVERGFRRLVIAGGETSGSVVGALAVRGGAIGESVSAGVPWIHTLDDDPLALLLKSGNFGSVDLFSRALEPEVP
jgi:uncharacterized protein YgbK (DUF1537 family)